MVNLLPDTVKFTVELPRELNDWLAEQAKLNLRSKSKQIEYLLKAIMEKQKASGEREGLR